MLESLPMASALASFLAAGFLGLLIGNRCAKVIARYVELIDANHDVNAATFALALRFAFTLRGGYSAEAFSLERHGVVGCRHALCCQAAMATATLGLYWAFGFDPAYWILVTAFAMLLVLSGIDLYRALLPDALTLPLLWLGMLASCWGFGISLHASVIGAAAAYLFLAPLAYGFQRLKGYAGMGGGDIKLLAALGAWIGWHDLPWALLMASCLGVVFAMGRQRTLWPRGAYPFGPFLAAGGVAVFVLKTAVHSWFP